MLKAATCLPKQTPRMAPRTCRVGPYPRCGAVRSLDRRYPNPLSSNFLRCSGFIGVGPFVRAGIGTGSMAVDVSGSGFVLLDGGASEWLRGRGAQAPTGKM